MSPRHCLLLAFLPGLLAAQTPRTGGPFEVKLEKPPKRYLLFVPEDYQRDRSWPMVIVLRPRIYTSQAEIKHWLPVARRQGYFVLCIGPADTRWSNNDGRSVLACLGDVNKHYRIDPDRLVLAGRRSGGNMATRWGLVQDKLWRCVLAHDGASAPKSLKVAKKRMSVRVTAGPIDRVQVRDIGRACAVMTTGGLRVAIGDIEGSVSSPKIWSSSWEFIQNNLDSPKARLERATRALKDKRLSDVIVAIEDIAAYTSSENRKSGIRAARLLSRADKLATAQVRKAQRLAKKSPKEARKTLLHIQKWFRGRKPGKAAKAALAELPAETAPSKKAAPKKAR